MTRRSSCGNSDGCTSRRMWRRNDTNRTSAIDRRTTRHIGYELSQQKRKRVEQSFGWMKVIGMLKKVKLRGLEKVGWLFTFTGAAYNLCRLRNLQVQAAL